MSEPVLAAALVALLAVLLVLRVPVAFALALTAFAHAFAAGIPPLSVAQKIAAQMADPTLAAIPFFILCGEIMSRGGLAARLIELAAALVGRVRGGLALVNIVASMFFGGVSGSSVADTSSIGSVLIPAMVARGYRPDFSMAVTVTSSTQGILIPPSHNAVLFSLAAGGAVSIQALFLAGYLPGLLIGLSLMLVALFLARRRGYPREAPVSVARTLALALAATPALVTPIVILVPIAFGWVPPDQAAILAVLWAALVATGVYRTLPLRRYSEVLLATCRTSAMVLLLIGAAAAFGEAMTYLHVPDLLLAALADATSSRLLLLLLVNLTLLALGAVMDMAPLIVILVPILLPVVTAVGVDPVHFGVVLLVNLAIGLCTPPVGSTLFVGCAIAGLSIEDGVRGMWPFYLAMLAVLALLTVAPPLSLWLPSLFAAGL